MRTIVVGDIHGCLLELRELLDQLQFRTGADRLISVGDLIDRGPDPVGVVHFMQEVGAEVVMGNHEEWALRYARHEARCQEDPHYKNPMRPRSATRLAQHAALSADDRQWLARLPIVLQFIHMERPWLVTHGGIPSNRALEQVDYRQILRCRWVDGAGAYASTGNPHELPPGSVYWTERWVGPQSVVYGHIRHDRHAVRIDVRDNGVECYGIDTGCCFGGWLTAAVFVPNRAKPEIHQVRAHTAYVPPRESDIST